MAEIEGDGIEQLENKAIKKAGSEKVKVIIRCRPLSEKEASQGHSKVVRVSQDKTQIQVVRSEPPKSFNSKKSSSFDSPAAGRVPSEKTFSFDGVYDERTSQTELYDLVFKELVDSVLQGFNGTIFAYGQTGTGKTHTMEGNRQFKSEEGVIPRAFRHIFDYIRSSPEKTFLVRASYLEIYQEEIRDLLNIKPGSSLLGSSQCQIKESSETGVYVKGLTSYLCKDFDEINALMNKGNQNRSIGATNMNEHSSRSHAIFMITVEMSDLNEAGECHIKVGKLNLVDLAGSERQSKTGAAGQRLREAVKINLSLSALGNVISALADGVKAHIPYRDSKLTRLLQDSLGGNSKTIMVATIGPSSYNFEETVVTLRYANRAKHIKNKPMVNEDPKDAMLRQYQEEILRLRELLDARRSSLGEEYCDEDNETEEEEDEFVVNELADIPLAQLSDEDESGDSDQNGPEAEADEVCLDHEEGGEHKKALDSMKGQRGKLSKTLETSSAKIKEERGEVVNLKDQIQWLESKLLNTGNTSTGTTERGQGDNEVNGTGNKALVKQDNVDDVSDVSPPPSDDEETSEDGKSRRPSVTLDKDQLTSRFIDKSREKQNMEDEIEFLDLKIAKINEMMEDSKKEHEKKLEKLKKYQQHLIKENQFEEEVVENFVPQRIQEWLYSLIVTDPVDGSLSLMPLSSMPLPRPFVNRSTLLPMFVIPATAQIHPVSGIYSTDQNILQLYPIPPISNTSHYIPPDTDPHVRSVMERAFSDIEKDVTIDCSKMVGRRRAQTARMRLGETLLLQNSRKVRQVLSSKHRSQEIPYKDFVDVTNEAKKSSKKHVTSSVPDSPYSKSINRTNQRPSTTTIGNPKQSSLSSDTFLYKEMYQSPIRRRRTDPLPTSTSPNEMNRRIDSYPYFPSELVQLQPEQIHPTIAIQSLQPSYGIPSSHAPMSNPLRQALSSNNFDDNHPLLSYPFLRFLNENFQ